MKQAVGDFWEKHKTLAQIIGILAVVAGLYANHSEVATNSSSIQSNNNWLKDAVKEQNVEIRQLQLDNAKLQQEMHDFETFYLIHPK